MSTPIRLGTFLSGFAPSPTAQSRDCLLRSGRASRARYFPAYGPWPAGLRSAATRSFVTRANLPTPPARSRVVRQGGALPGSVEAYLDTRMVGLVVHVDDLAVSVGLDIADDIERKAYATVAAILAQLAAAREGGPAMARSLCTSRKAATRDTGTVNADAGRSGPRPLDVRSAACAVAAGNCGLGV